MTLAPRTLVPRLAALAVAGLLIAGCSTPAAVDSGTPAGNNRPAASTTSKAPAPDTETTAAETPDAETEAPAAEDDGTAAFGSTYTWEDGISITVGKPTTYKPSEWAAGTEKGTTPMMMTVTLVNKSGAPFDPSLISLSAQSGNEEASQIYDGEKLGDSPSTKVLKGREVTFKVAFAVSDPKDLVVEVAPDWDHESVIFTS